MKRWLWLLALPYVVTVSSTCVKHGEWFIPAQGQDFEKKCEKHEPFYILSDGNAKVFTSKSRIVIDDMAEALRDARNRRDIATPAAPLEVTEIEMGPLCCKEWEQCK